MEKNVGKAPQKSMPSPPVSLERASGSKGGRLDVRGGTMIRM